MAARDAELAQEAPVLALLATEADGAADWLRSGQALERLLLTAAAEGLLASYLNQPLQLAGLRPRASGLLSRAGFAQVALRLGYPTEEPPSAPRRPVAAVVEGIRPEVGEG